MENTIELCIVNIHDVRIFNFAMDMEQAKEVLQRANESKESDIKAWTENCSKYPNVELYVKYLSDAENTEYKIMMYNEFLKLEREKLLSKPLKEITEEEFDEMLNVLPPMKWCTINGIELFCMSEMWTGSYTSQYAHDKRTCKYYTKMVDCMDRTTWINTLLV